MAALLRWSLHSEIQGYIPCATKNTQSDMIQGILRETLRCRFTNSPTKADKQLGGPFWRSISAESQHPAHQKIKWHSASFDSARLEDVYSECMDRDILEISDFRKLSGSHVWDFQQQTKWVLKRWLMCPGSHFSISRKNTVGFENKKKQISSRRRHRQTNCQIQI